MPQGERNNLLIAGAVIGVLAVLVTLFALVDKLDQRYLPRAEASVRLQAIQTSVDEVKYELRRHMEKP